MVKILIVDDDPEMVLLMSKYLSGEGYDVVTAGDSVAALRATATQEPQLVLLDIVIGSEDGRDVLRELRMISDVPVIFLTGRGLESERIAGLKLGADDYIVKPFSLGEVTARIESVLRRASNKREHSRGSPQRRVARPHFEGIHPFGVSRFDATSGLHESSIARPCLGVVE
jgi:DNA-binding response OmpR family regulator